MARKWNASLNHDYHDDPANCTLWALYSLRGAHIFAHGHGYKHTATRRANDPEESTLCCHPSGSSYGILWHMLDDVGKTNLSRHLKISCCKSTYILISRLWWSEMSPWLPVVITRSWVDSGMRPRIKFRSVSTVLSILQSIIVFAGVKVSDH